MKAQADFNPRLREGGDKCPIKASILYNISIHTSAKEATILNALSKQIPIFQSTPPRRRRLHWFKLEWIDKRFQSTPPRRRRRNPASLLRSAMNFNPRLREGGDNNDGETDNTPVISIHASAREATEPSELTSTPVSYFNPRLREGGDR